MHRDTLEINLSIATAMLQTFKMKSDTRHLHNLIEYDFYKKRTLDNY